MSCSVIFASNTISILVFISQFVFYFIGAVIYFGYGMSHSTEELKTRPRILEPVNSYYPDGFIPEKRGSYGTIEVNSDAAVKPEHSEKSVPT